MSKCEEKGILHKQILGGIFVKPRYFIALKHNWSAQPWKWPPWASLFGGRLEFNYGKAWLVSDKERSFKRCECCPLWGISTQPHLHCATAQKQTGRARTTSIYSFLISADTNGALGNSREKMKHLQTAFFFFFYSVFFFPLRDGVNISKFYKGHHFELIFISQ